MPPASPSQSFPATTPQCPVRLDPTGSALQEEANTLRERGPAVLVELPGDIAAWSVTRYDVIRSLTADPRVSRDPWMHWPERDTVPEDWPLAVPVFGNSFFNAYGEEHRRLRRMVTPAFTPRRVQAMAPSVKACAHDLVNALARTPVGGVADLRSALCRPLTTNVINDLLGVPQHMRTPVADAIDGILDTSATPEQARAAQTELWRSLSELRDYKRANLGADLVSDLVSPDEGEPMSDERLIGTLFLMIAAGFETTVNLIANAAHTLLTNPGMLERMLHGDLDVADVVEESLRCDGPVMHIPLRYAVEDIDLGEGVVIQKGDPILIAFGAAGRDPALHPDAPGTFDPDRESKEHLDFGFGAHYCLGAHLARLEAATGLTVLFETLPDIVLAEPDKEPPRLVTFFLNGPSELLVIPRPDQSRTE